MLKLKLNEKMSDFVESIINTVPEPLFTLDKDLRVVTANGSFYKVFKLKPENTIGHIIFELDNNQWDIPALRELLGTILPQKTSIDNYVLDHDFANIGRRVMLLNARQMEQAEGKDHTILLVMQDITERSDELVIANQELAFQNVEKDKRAIELGIVNQELASQNLEKDKWAGELILANIEKDKQAVELVLANEERDKRAVELVIANKQKKNQVEELAIANEELGFQNSEKDKRAAELVIANEELGFQNSEKDKRAAELVIANEELGFQNSEKDKRAAELVIANKEKVKRADELVIANEELAIQNVEKDKRADELIIANEEKVKRADKLVIANEKLAFQNVEKEKRAAELATANKKLAFQNVEKEKRADELIIANEEKVRRADKLVIANKEKDKRAAELATANEELGFQSSEKDKRAAELVIANKEIDKRSAELVIANEELILQNEEKQLLLRKLKRAASVFTHAHEGIMITDATAIITEVNDTFSQITGYTREDMLGKNPNILQSGRHPPEFFNKMWEALLAQGYWRGEIWNRRKNGDVYPEILTISVVKNAKGKVLHYVSLSTDITSLKNYQGQLEHIAHYDVLTNLPNRVLLADRLSQAMAHCQRHKQSLAVAFMDLDRFKEVNDNYGHDVGDKLLIALSQRMKDALREGDTLARIGGDEFIAIMGDLQNIKLSTAILERLLKVTSDPVIVDGINIQVSASIGVTFYPQDNSGADHLMRHADQAMYSAKQAGKNCYRLFDVEQAYAGEIQLENIDNIRLAMERCEFLLHYQPKVNMRTGAVIGTEALIRWQHPESGLIPSLEFLPAMEGQPVSLEMGEWVIDTALNQISDWQNIGINLPISVNISAYQLQQDDFVIRLKALLATYPEVSPPLLELEILETSALHDIIQVSATMNECHKLGVRFALDDFGTGYSSLTHLRRLPAQLIKIDQTFVRDMLEDADDLAIVKGVIGLAQAFECEVIAEGVETIAHGEALLKLGCELAQGYGIARPMPANKIPEWISNWKTDDSWK